MKTLELAAKIQSELVELRRHFHMYPEPSFKEVNTANKVAEELTKLGIPFRRLAKTGLVATIKGGKPGRIVALRADMDALSIKEETGAPYASRNEGFMHACGHDCHTTCLLGAAKILSRLQNEIHGTVVLLFQPAEELIQGAKAMVDEGAMDGVDAVFGMHVSSQIDAGRLNVSPGPRMASADIFKITINGQGGHGSAPHQGVDAIVAGSALVMNLQTIVSRETRPLDPVVVHVGKFESGDRFNIIASKAVLEGANRTFDQETRAQLPEIMKRIVDDTAATFRASAELEYTWGCPPLINDETLAALAQSTIKKLYGDDALVETPKVTGSEDFPYFAEKAPGVFAYLGVRNEEKGLTYPAHHARFDVDESALQIGAAVYAQFALDYLSQ